MHNPIHKELNNFWPKNKPLNLVSFLKWWILKSANSNMTLQPNSFISIDYYPKLRFHTQQYTKYFLLFSNTCSSVISSFIGTVLYYTLFKSYFTFNVKYRKLK